MSDGDTLFWDLVEPMLADPAVTRSTTMGLLCVRYEGRFFASLEHRTGALLVTLPASRVAELTDGPQILALYDVLAEVAPGPLVTLSRAVAVAMVHGPGRRRHPRRRRTHGTHPPAPRLGTGDVGPDGETGAPRTVALTGCV